MHCYHEIRKWGEERGLYQQSSFNAQFEKLIEEYGELYKSVRKHNLERLPDDIGDNHVVLLHLGIIARVDVRLLDSEPSAITDPVDATARLLGAYSILLHSQHIKSTVIRQLQEAVGVLKGLADYYDLNYSVCVSDAVDEISSRTGWFINGVYVKDA